MAVVASLYHLPPRVLPSIQTVEGGGVGVVHRNANGSEDLGVMQVNTVWVAALSAYTRRESNIVRGRLIADGCYNIAAAGAIMRVYLNEAHGDLMQAIGFYHSHTMALSQIYQDRVRQAARGLFTERAAKDGGPQSR